MVHSLRGAVDAFLEANGIPETQPISVGNQRPECVVVVGVNREEPGIPENGETNIEFMDMRFPATGGYRAHAKLSEFVTFL
ncbi:hypothetical protein HDU98_005511 [Podochytrium sp. JEL0797]|nr:hypothetical protein HDU98_005511 [Podochytrium sp. JEL0797]